MQPDFLIDTHAHLDMFGSNEVIRKVISAAFRENVGKIVAVGDNLDSSRRVAGLTEQFKRVFGAVGVHPHNADQVDDGIMQQVWAVSNQPKIVAIGETGLDFYKMRSAKDKQLSTFNAHIELAKHLKMPLIVHCRDAFPEIIQILKKSDIPAGRVVIHCFSGDINQAMELLGLGCYLSFAGNITFDNAEPLRQVLKAVPLENILTETDCPYLSPRPHRGEQNEPAFLPLVADTMAQVKDIDIADVVKVTSSNADKLFNFS